jgi:hypothetical protein
MRPWLFGCLASLIACSFVTASTVRSALVCVCEKTRHWFNVQLCLTVCACVCSAGEAFADTDKSGEIEYEEFKSLLSKKKT